MIIRTSITFDYYPDEDELMQGMTEEEQLTYCKESMIEDIYSFIKYNELADAVDVEIIND